MQCYIVLYSEEGYFLTFTKKNKVIFSKGKMAIQEAFIQMELR